MRWTLPRSPNRTSWRWRTSATCITSWASAWALQRLHQQIEALPADSYWETLAKIALGDELAEVQRSIALEVLSRHDGSALQMLQAWEGENQQELQSAQRLLAELADAKSADLAMLSVALRKLRNLA